MLINYNYLLIFVIFMQSVNKLSSSDPYKILGVQRNAPSNEIKRAYKKLARIWHPDKNKNPEAEDEFVKITKAYELLMDPDRKEEYNRFGTTEDTPNFRHKRDYSDFKRFDFDPFETIFTSGGGSGSSFNFNFNQNQAFIFHRQTISAKAYQNKILPASVTSPQLILFYGDLCFPCFNVEPVWHKIVLELEPLGVDFATIHSKHESNLARKIGIDDLPYIIGIVDGVVRHYKDNQLSLLRIIEFIRKILPRHLITQVNDENYESFLSGWTDNRVRVLFVNNDKLIKLRYLLTAFYFRERVVCGHVSIKEKDSLKLIQRYGVDIKMDSMLIFNEDINRPIATLAASELLPQIIKDVLHSNKYLLLPRITSQVMFDQICPPDAPRSRRRLCIMLVTNNIPTQESEKEAIRQFILENEFSEDKFRFMYIYQEKQMDFINSLSIGSGSPSDLISHIVVLWRREHDRLLYEWLPNVWDVSEPEKLNKSKSDLHDLLNKLSKTTQTMANNAKMVNLIDEHASGLIGRVLKRILVLTGGLGDSISQKEVLPILSAVATFVFIGIFGYILQYLVKLEEKNIREQYRRLGRTPPGSNPRNEFKLSIHELRGETYNGLIRLLKPGCRTLVLLCDITTKSKLLPKFYRFVHPYRKNKTLMFSYLLIEKNIEWYKKILQQSLGDHRELNINPKNCIGTVLAINGFKRYFCVYHVKHSELNRRAEHQDFLGFEDEEEDVEAGNLIEQRSDQTNSTEAQEFVFENNLLDSLPQWLERLFEGTTHRYFIQFWPDNMK